MAFYLYAQKLLSTKMRRSKSDMCVNVAGENTDSVCVSHVDDFLITSPDNKLIPSALGKTFQLKHHENPETYIGYELEYYDTPLKKSIMYGSNSPFTVTFDDALSQAAPNLRSAKLSETQVDQKLYRSLVGVIQYVAAKTRFDVQFYGTNLSRFNHCPTPQMMNQAIQVMKFLYKTRHYSSYVFNRSKTKSNLLEIYTDASYNIRASDELTAKKHPPFGGYVILLNGNYVTSRSYSIRAATVSSVYEAELIAMHDGVKRGLALLPVLYDMCFKDVKINVYCDNKPLRKVVSFLKQIDYEAAFLNRVSYLRDKHGKNVFSVHEVKG